MAPLGSGRFIITNSKFKNVAYLANADSYSDLRADAQRDRPGEKWNVVLLRNGNYTIQNHDYSKYATCEDIVKPDVGNRIVGGDRDSQQWKIIEVQGNSYVICPTKNRQVCWHLEDEESGTDITLDHYSHTDKIQWKFSPPEESERSGAIGGDKDDDAPLTPVLGATVDPPTGPANGWYTRDEDDDAPSTPVPGATVDPPTGPETGWYTISPAGTSLYLTPKGLSSKPPMPNTRVVLSNSMPYKLMWLMFKFADGWVIAFCDVSGTPSNQLFLSMPDSGELGSGELCLTRIGDSGEDVSGLSLNLNPVGGPNEFRITEVKSGRSWGRFVMKYQAIYQD